MDFKDFMERAWKEHASQPLQVSLRIEPAFRLIEEPEQIAAMAHLATHVLGEHLGRWEEGVRLLEELKRVRAYKLADENARTVARCVASLELAAGKRTGVTDFSDSDRIRILAITAAALTEQGAAPRAQTLFRQGLKIAQRGLPPEDPANRALAVAGNNLACALEEKPARSVPENDLMILAAQTARTYWGIAGAWLQWERAEYRLARTYLQAGDPVRSLEHAGNCLEICERNGASALELFFAYEAMALARQATRDAAGFERAVTLARSHFDALNAEDQGSCTAALADLR